MLVYLLTQKAGQRPQVLLGIWAMSAMKRPWVHVALLVMRIDLRPVASLGSNTLVWSTPQLGVEPELMSPLLTAVS